MADGGDADHEDAAMSLSSALEAKQKQEIKELRSMDTIFVMNYVLWHLVSSHSLSPLHLPAT